MKVLIGTPSYDGKVDVWFANALLRTVKMSFEKGVDIRVIYTSYDSLVQRARNSLFRLFLIGDFDALFFIDSDTDWEPEWFFSILERPEHIVGAALVKKSSTEGYTVKLVDKNLCWSEDKQLIEVDGLGTGFMKLSRFAVTKLWNISDIYYSEGEEHRMVCDIKVVDGDLISEDYVIANKWRTLGYKVWLNPSFTIKHNGVKKYEGDFKKFIEKNGYT